jgi:hypothetical protein
MTPAQCFDAAVEDGTNTVYMTLYGEPIKNYIIYKRTLITGPSPESRGHRINDIYCP